MSRAINLTKHIELLAAVLVFCVSQVFKVDRTLMLGFLLLRVVEIVFFGGAARPELYFVYK